MTTTTNHPASTDHRGRNHRGVAAVVAAGIAVATLAALAAPAGALPVTTTEPGSIERPRDLGITGSLTLVGCTAAASQLKVAARGKDIATNGEFEEVTASGSAGHFTFEFAGLERGTYDLTPRLAAGLCPFGTWVPTVRSVVGGTTTANKVVRGVNFAYNAPAHVTRISAGLAAAAVEGALSGTRVHLNSFGPRHGQSNHLPNSSTVTVAGQTSVFTIPDFQIDLDCGILCPDLGQGRFYVNDVNLASVDVGWASAFTFDGAFESSGREVKGFFTDATTGIVSDSLMPDVQIDDAHLRFSLVPVADGAGSITYRRSGEVAFDGTIQATGPCNLFGVDVCDPLFGYKDQIRSAVGSPVGTLLDSALARQAVSQQFRSLLTSLGIGAVTGVRIEADAIVVLW